MDTFGDMLLGENLPPTPSCMKKKMIISKISVMQNTKMDMNEFIWGYTIRTEPSSNAPIVGKIYGY
jgi:hypothetical protein